MNRFPRNDIISLVGAAPRHDLAESLGPSLAAGELLQPGDDLHALSLGYGSAQGGLALREAIAAQHGVAASDVVVTVGGAHALFLLAFTLCASGDEAIVANPVFPLARNALAAVGAEVRPLQMRFDADYQPDLDELRALLSPRTKLVSLASPQNPAGVSIRPRTLNAIVKMLQQHAPQAWLLMDETYRLAAYGDDAVAASALQLGSRVVSISSLSKCHGAPGLRIGWAITRDATLRDQLVAAKFNTVISCSPLDEALALRALQREQSLIGPLRERLACNLALVADWVQRHAELIDWVRPDAGALCCVRLRREVYGDASVERFHAALAEEGARVGDGRWFGEAARVFRLGFGLPEPADLPAALDAVSRALRRSAGRLPSGGGLAETTGEATGEATAEATTPSIV